MRGVKSPTCEVGEPITDLVVTLHDEANIIAVKGVADQEYYPTDVAMELQVRWLDAVLQEEVKPPLICP